MTASVLFAIAFKTLVGIAQTLIAHYKRNTAMIKVYVAGAYSADNVIDVLKNIGRGKSVCADLFLFGFAPFCPWHDSSYVMDRFYENFTVKQFYEYSIAWLEVSDAMFVIHKNLETSKGTKAEIEIADSLGIPIFYTLEALLEWRTIQND